MLQNKLCFGAKVANVLYFSYNHMSDKIGISRPLSAVQFSAVQCSALQCGAVQCSAVFFPAGAGGAGAVMQ